MYQYLESKSGGSFPLADFNVKYTKYGQNSFQSHQDLCTKIIPQVEILLQIFSNVLPIIIDMTCV